VYDNILMGLGKSIRLVLLMQAQKELGKLKEALHLKLKHFHLRTPFAMSKSLVLSATSLLLLQSSLIMACLQLTN